MDVPPYAAVMWCNPPASVDVVYVATPPESATVVSRVRPSENETDPVGVPLSAVIVAVNVTLWASVEGFAELPSAVVVEGLPIVSKRTADVEGARPGVPSKCAVRL